MRSFIYVLMFLGLLGLGAWAYSENYDMRARESEVAQLQAEIGTLRALGFRRASVLAAFLVEALLLGLVGGVMGLACASVMQVVSFSTTNFQTFSDLSFRFLLTPEIAVKTLLFSVAMGLAGGFLPALRASRLNIVDALRAA